MGTTPEGCRICDCPLHNCRGYWHLLVCHERKHGPEGTNAS